MPRLKSSPIFNLTALAAIVGAASTRATLLPFFMDFGVGFGTAAVLLWLARHQEKPLSPEWH